MPWKLCYIYIKPYLKTEKGDRTETLTDIKFTNHRYMIKLKNIITILWRVLSKPNSKVLYFCFKLKAWNVKQVILAMKWFSHSTHFVVLKWMLKDGIETKLMFWSILFWLEGWGGRGLGVTVFPSYFYLKKKIGKKRIIIYSLWEGRKAFIDQFCWTCNEREFYTIIWKCGPVSNWSSSGSQSYFKGQLMRGMCSHRLMFC